jgi:NAD(P)-dependent dehydrogenase (short-subunit alcohol dehydrogenase family)
MTNQKVWFITGSSRGLGRSLTEAVLKKGDFVIATARNPKSLADLTEQYGEQIHPLALDVADEQAVFKAVEQANEVFGRLDVVVNNAGYGDIASIEDVTLADFHAQMNTNFYGVVYVTKAALPFMRKQASGNIIQISSVGGRIGSVGLAAYQSAKWAVGGFSEMLREHSGQEPSDPVKVAQVITELPELEEPPLRLLIGSDAVDYANAALQARAESDAKWRYLSESVNFTS